MQVALTSHLLGIIGSSIRVERPPARLKVLRTTVLNVHCQTIHHAFNPASIGWRNAGCDERSSTTYALRIHLGIFLAYAHTGECADDSASDPANRGTAQNRQEPPQADDRTNAGYGEQGQQTRCGSGRCASAV